MFANIQFDEILVFANIVFWGFEKEIITRYLTLNWPYLKKLRSYWFSILLEKLRNLF